MANTYDIGDVIRIAGAFTQSAVAIDPGTVVLVVKPPTGASTTYDFALAQITKDSTGVFHKDIAIAQSGIYRYRWTSTGTGEASEESWFTVRTRKVA